MNKVRERNCRVFISNRKERGKKWGGYGGVFRFIRYAHSLLWSGV